MPAVNLARPVDAGGRLHLDLILLIRAAAARGWRVAGDPHGHGLVWRHRNGTVRSAAPAGPDAVRGIAAALAAAERPHLADAEAPSCR